MSNNILILSNSNGLKIPEKYFNPIWDYVWVMNSETMDKVWANKAKTYGGIVLGPREINFVIESLSDQIALEKEEVLHTSLKQSQGRYTCEICSGTGFRKTPPETGPGDYPCNRCGQFGFYFTETLETVFSKDMCKVIKEFLINHCKNENDFIEIRLENHD